MCDGECNCSDDISVLKERISELEDDVLSWKDKYEAACTLLFHRLQENNSLKAHNINLKQQILSANKGAERNSHKIKYYIGLIEKITKELESSKTDPRD